MRFKSTGLGRTELIAKFGKLERSKENKHRIVLHLVTTEPVRWEMSAAMEGRDLASVAGTVVKASYWLIPFVVVAFVKYLWSLLFRAKAKGNNAEAGTAGKEKEAVK